MNILLSNSELETMGGYNTAQEIKQQPQVWKQVYELINNQKEEITQFFQMISDKHENVRIILTGAGTSAFVGETLKPYLQKLNGSFQSIESIATTDIVSAPDLYLKEKVPTVLVSFARSGNSPESTAAVDLSEQLINDIYQIVITCNHEGALAKRSQNNPNTLLIELPEETNDKGFAMTSSFTSMMLSCLLIFDLLNLDENEGLMNQIIHTGNDIITSKELESISTLYFNRVVYLGSAGLGGLAKESALKMLELTDGKVITIYDTPLGFRHGPKSVLNTDTLVIMYLSNNEYTKKYDVDLLKEIWQEKNYAKILVVSPKYSEELEQYSDLLLTTQISDENVSDAYLGFCYVLVAQMIAFNKSIALSISPDNPCTDGSVNRVVQGVTIYPFN